METEPFQKKLIVGNLQMVNGEVNGQYFSNCGPSVCQAFKSDYIKILLLLSLSDGICIFAKRKMTYPLFSARKFDITFLTGYANAGIWQHANKMADMTWKQINLSKPTKF